MPQKGEKRKKEDNGDQLTAFDWIILMDIATRKLDKCFPRYILRCFCAGSLYSNLFVSVRISSDCSAHFASGWIDTLEKNLHFCRSGQRQEVHSVCVGCHD